MPTQLWQVASRLMVFTLRVKKEFALLALFILKLLLNLHDPAAAAHGNIPEGLLFGCSYTSSSL